jgi:serine/threonine protein kinase
MKNLFTTPYQDYLLTSKIGFGKYSTVYKGMATRDKKEVAVKEVKIKDMTKTECADFRYELNLLSQLSHSAFIKLEAVYEPSGPAAKFYVVSEYLKGGELISALIRNQSYSEEDVIHYSFQIISGIHYLHSRGVVHGNIIPENIVLMQQDISDREKNHVKIVGFDLAQCQHTKRTARTRLIDDQFLAPELDCNHQSVEKNPRSALNREMSALSVATGLSRTISIGGFSLTPTILANSIMAANQEKEEENNANASHQPTQQATREGDVWSFGIMLYLLLSGSMPYEHLDPYENVSHIMISFRL